MTENKCYAQSPGRVEKLPGWARKKNYQLLDVMKFSVFVNDEENEIVFSECVSKMRARWDRRF
jgi:hypothetical protein